MLTIICGEDIIASRAAYNKIREQYRAQGYEIRSIAGSEIVEMKKWILESPMLFAPRVAYFSEYAIKYAKSRKDRALYKEIDDLAVNTDVQWIDWEKFTAREITGVKKAVIQEYKPSETIFSLLDSFYPGNLKQVASAMEIVTATQEEGFVFAMLSKHVRSLLLIRQGIVPAGMKSWQAGRLRTQAQRWAPEKLLLFYEGLIRIDRSLKTSSNTHGLKNSIDILCCYVL